MVTAWLDNATKGHRSDGSALEHLGVLRISWNIVEQPLKPQELAPEVKRLAIRCGLTPMRLQIGLGLEYILLAQPVEIAFQANTIGRHIEQGGDDLRQTLRTLNRQRIPMTQFDEVLQAYLIEMRGDDVGGCKLLLNYRQSVMFFQKKSRLS